MKYSNNLYFLVRENTGRIQLVYPEDVAIYKEVCEVQKREIMQVLFTELERREAMTLANQENPGFANEIFDMSTPTHPN